MTMTVQQLAVGNFEVRQDLNSPPIVYLDHWAVRMFSEQSAIQQRFIRALHASGGTLLLSHMNFAEFAAMTDLGQAEATERFLDDVLPALYVADFTSDPGFMFPGGSPDGPDNPGKHWLFKEVSKQCVRNGGKLTMNSMVTYVVKHRDELQPVFVDMKQSIAQAVVSLRDDPAMSAKVSEFRPHVGMTLHDALIAELLRSSHIDHGAQFTANDAVDLVHAVPTVILCDFVLLDGKWCDRIARADRRMRAGGMRHTLARCYSNRGAGVHEFLSALEAYGP